MDTVTYRDLQQRRDLIRKRLDNKRPDRSAEPLKRHDPA